eukprot:TRINITY_DN1265_c0_g2_i3.p1 TRINITY_DN1265_c0_g2~~TRINITY_DN1265_c0_g2_i3.p1  ORF type:complete len:102 (+),score=10.57 TRINITY_DN1265_c0_g2_i3:3-308(+)
MCIRDRPIIYEATATQPILNRAKSELNPTFTIIITTAIRFQGPRQLVLNQQSHHPLWWSSPRYPCLLYTSDAADEEDSVDLGGRRRIKKKKKRGEDWTLVV